MGYVIGGVLAVLVSLFARVVRLDRDRAFYPTVAIVVAHYYVLFAVMGGSVHALAIELMVMTAFVFGAVAGLRLNMWFAVAALAGHGVLDAFHAGLIDNPGVPVWWPAFCGTYDIVAAALLAWLLMERRVLFPRTLAVLGAAAFACCVASPASAQQLRVEHKVVATSKTSTMETELNDAADAGYRFEQVMGGELAVGGKEVVVVMTRIGNARERYDYRLLATTKTSTMQKELQGAADEGFEYRGQTVFTSAFGGDEVIVILERDRLNAAPRFTYRLMATTRTSTLEKELRQAGDVGYEIVGLTVGKTAIGGTELVAVTRKPR